MLRVVGCSHRTAPVELRERLAFVPDELPRALDELVARYGCETVILSTCNRVELYVARAVHGRPRAEELVEFVAEFNGVDAGEFSGHLYQKTDRDVVWNDENAPGKFAKDGDLRKAHSTPLLVTGADGRLQPASTG